MRQCSPTLINCFSCQSSRGRSHIRTTTDSFPSVTIGGYITPQRDKRRDNEQAAPDTMTMHFHWNNFRATTLRKLRCSVAQVKHASTTWEKSHKLPQSYLLEQQCMYTLFILLLRSCPQFTLFNDNESYDETLPSFSKTSPQMSLCPLNSQEIKPHVPWLKDPQAKPCSITSHQVLISTNTSADHDGTVLCPYVYSSNVR